MKVAAAALAVAALAGRVAADAAANAQIFSSLVNAQTQDQRIAILANDSQFVFDFLDPNAERTQGEGGFITLANALTFPALYTHGMAMALGVLGPCSINSPHTHPRATEFNVALNGTLHTGMLSENGARFVVNEVGVLSATFFPAGAIHFEANLNCQPVYFIAAFNHIDPGVQQVAQRFFGLPPDIVGDSLGGLGVEQVQGIAQMIPDNIILAGDDCFARCGISKPPQPTKQQQPRVSGNAFNSSPFAPPVATTGGNYYGAGPFGAVSAGAGPSATGPPPSAGAPPPTSAPAAPPPASYSSSAAAPALGGGGGAAAAAVGGGHGGNGGYTSQMYPGAFVAAAQGNNNGGSSSSSGDDSTVKTLLVVVLAINGLLVLGLIVGGAVLLFRRGNGGGGNGGRPMMMAGGGSGGRYARTKSDDVVFSAEHHDEPPSGGYRDAPPPAGAQGKWYDDPYADKPSARPSTDEPRREY